MGKNIVPEPSLSSADRKLADLTLVVAAMIGVNATLAVVCGAYGHPWACALNAATAAFNLRAVLHHLEDR